MAIPGPYSPDADPAGRRALRLAALSYLTRRDGGDAAQALFDAADNMTEELAALAILLAPGGARRRCRPSTTSGGTNGW